MAEYSSELPAKVAYAPEDLRDPLGEVIAAAGLKQLRIAETEKYAHHDQAALRQAATVCSCSSI
jgi:2,3-bisphosphoglycerate-independent phosphoglycerate mutase